MSQNKVYQGLKEIGGEGTTTELRDHLSEKFPDSTLADYAVNRLRQLEEKGVVKIDDSSTPYRVVVIDDNWDGIKETLAERDFPPESEDEE
jgi:PleD family two-component response regulator